ncbi:nucleoside kinase [Petroclostridium sp. X23]|uniref:nucleoside kinase n=1 Tax=Petroclostridium sp. X23 TaxID=3045146 RepID=UPI0024AE8541|nr:nucleoside kinase [Petroclostridium sp. X23]WHH59069.1 nucleoside kinase [Petroclostridium sp. X23]
MLQKEDIIKVNLEQTQIEVKKGTTLLELGRLYKHDTPLDILAGKVDNKIKDLHYKLDNDCTVQFVDLSSGDGVRVYKRSLFFILKMAVRELYPDRKLSIRHSISRGTYCEIYGESSITEIEVHAIEEKMKSMISQEIPIYKNVITLEEAKEIFYKSEDYDKVSLLEHCKKDTISLYKCGDMSNYLYGYLVPHTGYIKKFDLMFYTPGFIIRYPDMHSPNDIPSFEESRKLFTVLDEYKRWGEILDVSHVGSLNKTIDSGGARDVIHISEALHEKKIAYIADMIEKGREDIKVVLISGPSSSGKTTFAHRLAIHLKVNGFKPVTISLDDYFVDREHTPIDEDGKPDFEALEAIDIQLFNKQLSMLINGQEVEIPIFNFHLGRREPHGRKLKLDNNQIAIIEGIHGMNEKLTASIPRKNKFKVYVSALTQLGLDNYNPISTTDTRLIRRMVRDYNFRSNSALRTLEMWGSVRRGETRNIFPFQEQADVMFNSALVYELSVLKKYAMPLLESIDRSCEFYSEARRLLDFLSYFLPIEPDDIPTISIMREFIGGSSLY